MHFESDHNETPKADYWEEKVQKVLLIEDYTSGVLTPKGPNPENSSLSPLQRYDSSRHLDLSNNELKKIESSIPNLTPPTIQTRS